MKLAMLVLNVLYFGLIATITLFNLVQHGINDAVFGFFGTAILWGIPYLILRFALMGLRKSVK